MFLCTYMVKENPKLEVSYKVCTALPPLVGTSVPATKMTTPWQTISELFENRNYLFEVCYKIPAD